MMKLRSTLPFVLLAGVLAGCQPSTDAGAPAAAPAAPADAPAAPAQAPEVSPEATGAEQEAAVEAVGLYANGFSPAWEAHLEGDTLRFSVPETGTPDNDLRTVQVKSAEQDGLVRYTGQDGEVALALEVRQEACTKSLNGEEKSRDFSATFRYGKSSYQGCADAVMEDAFATNPEEDRLIEPESEESASR